MFWRSVGLSHASPLEVGVRNSFRAYCLIAASAQMPAESWRVFNCAGAAGQG